MPGLARENPPVLLQPVAPNVMPDPASILDEMSGNFVYGTRKQYPLRVRASESRLAGYVVQPGDSLWTIALANDTDVSTIVGLNPRINPDVIQPGQILQVARGFRGIAHTVRSGETLATIADSFAVPAAQIREANGLSADVTLTSDEVVLVPGAKSAAPRNQLASRDGSTRRQAQAPAAHQTGTATASATVTKPASSQGHQTSMIWPLTGGLITTEFGRSHAGIDIARPTGTKVVAAKGGTVVFAGWDKDRGYGYGFQIIIDHGDGFRTRYAHASSILVRNGQTVAQGDPIMLVGSTGHSTGPHLHFEVVSDGTPVNPRSVLP